MKHLQIDRPIVFLDLEATGLDVAFDRIVELTVLKISPDGTRESKTVRINPGIPIPADVVEIHGITNEDVADKPKFGQYAKGIKEFLEGCDIGGFGIKRYDLPLLEAEFKRAEVDFSRQGRRIIDVQTIYHKVDPRDLAVAYRKYCGKELQDRHTSEADVLAAVEVLECQLEVHQELPKDVGALHAFCNPEKPNSVDPEGKFVWFESEAVIDFGKHKGKSLRELVAAHPDYLQWIASRDFSAEVKEIAAKALCGEFPKRVDQPQVTDNPD